MGIKSSKRPHKTGHTNMNVSKQQMMLTHSPARPHQDFSHFEAGFQGVLLVGCWEGGTMLEVF